MNADGGDIVMWLGDDGPIDDRDFPVSPESIARAKAARDAERARLIEQTGVRITEDGQITADRTKPTGGVR